MNINLSDNADIAAAAAAQVNASSAAIAALLHALSSSGVLDAERFDQALLAIDPSITEAPSDRIGEIYREMIGSFRRAAGIKRPL